jgi:plastocyanin
VRILVVAVAIVLGAGVPTHADDYGVTIVVRDGGFEPAEVKVPRGPRIRLEVANETAAKIEFESVALNRERIVKPGERATLYLTDLSPGRYEFFDELHRERRGVLLVE